MFTMLNWTPNVAKISTLTLQGFKWGVSNGFSLLCARRGTSLQTDDGRKVELKVKHPQTLREDADTSKEGKSCL